MFQPHPLRVLTTFGVTAAVSGTRKNISDLWTPYASNSCVHMPVLLSALSFADFKLNPVRTRVVMLLAVEIDQGLALS